MPCLVSRVKCCWLALDQANYWLKNKLISSQWKIKQYISNWLLQHARQILHTSRNKTFIGTKLFVRNYLNPPQIVGLFLETVQACTCNKIYIAFASMVAKRLLPKARYIIFLRKIWNIPKKNLIEKRFTFINYTCRKFSSSRKEICQCICANLLWTYWSMQIDT